MKTAKLSEVKDHLSSFVERARTGEAVRILVRGVPAADLVPVGPDGLPSARLVELERRGVLVRGRGGPIDALLDPGPVVSGSPSDELVAERRSR